MKHTKKVLSGFIAMSMALPIAAPAELLSVSDVLTVKAADQQKTGKTADGYDYELWNQNYTGNVDMQLGSNGGFSCSWSGIENCLFRTGKKLGSTKGYKDYGNISITYDVDYQPMGNSYMCVYGWTEDPTVEYYIVEAWGDWRPPGQQGGKGTVSADGKTYDIYTSTRVNQPSIHGTETFEQYWSVNKTNPAQVNAMKNLKGTITVSDHFAAWERSGMKMGKMYEVALNIEGYRSSGKANVKKNDLQIGGARSSSTQPAASQAPVAKINGTPVSAGTGLSTDCESNAGGWTARGDSVELLLSGDMKNGGSKALAVTGRSASWNGIQNASSDLKAGGSYSFSSSVGYKNDNYSSAGFTFGVQYDLGGETNYDNIADATASSGKMTKLAGDFKIPSGAENISLYVQTAYSENDTDADLIDFFIDDIKVTGDGSSSSTVTQPTSGNSTQPVSRPSSGGQEVNDGSLKGKFGACFKIGTSVSPHELGSGGDFIKKHFNSITPENELKPDALLSPGSDNTRAKVSLSKAAQTLKFCEQNGIALRGHTFVWYSQTPDWFFKENFSSNGNYVSKDIMNQRLENFIKDTFDLLAKEYPKLEVYAYDVCNELFVNDGGGLRPGSNSGWTRVYGDKNDEFIINAFTYARKYAPAGCKLYINDYNEYIPAKTNDIYNIAMKLKEKGVIDGIGMQSHLDISYPSAQVYKTGLEKFLSTGLDVQITELDITCGSDFNTQAKLYADVFQMAVDHADQIPALTVWGTNDSISWRRENNPLLFSSGYKAKPAFDAVMKVDTSSVKSQAPASQAPASQAPASQAPAQNPTQNIVQNPSTQAPAAADFKFGDLNNDGKIDITDLSLLAVHLIDKTKFTDKQTLAADVAYNGKVELADLATLRQFISKVIDKLGEGYVAPKASPSPSPSPSPSQQAQQHSWMRHARTRDSIFPSSTAQTVSYLSAVSCNSSSV
ncbi:MAG: endo-1,4-beta-xylanase [Oscillospiraceae bacterium]|nr:endo-1,4-beta-xylanase [Oscillospiraceae bacterium]